MSHANAALTPRARLRLARLIVDQGWSPARAAERYDVSWRTASKWAARYRAGGEAGMADRTSRPRHQPHRTPAPVVRKIVHLHRKRRWGPVAIADELGLAASTVHAVRVRCRLNRLSHLDRITGEAVRRYEYPPPGDMLHVDVKKLGNVPDGGGRRYLGRQAGDRNRAATAGKPRNKHHNPLIGTAFVHTVIDDHSRVAYAEIHNDETAATATSVLRNATTGFAARGVSTRRVLSDNGSAYQSHLWRDTCAELGIRREEDPPLPATNQRQDRTIPPHPGRRLGLHPPLPIRTRTPSSPTPLAPLLQSPPTPLSHRRQTTHHPTDQPP
jgi:transposase InsO family protein